MSYTVHVRSVDDSFTEWTADSLVEARQAVEARAAELGPRFSHAQAWENRPLGLRVGFDAAEGWSDAHARVLAPAAAPGATSAGAGS
jgi:hypothetical protein